MSVLISAADITEPTLAFGAGDSTIGSDRSQEDSGAELRTPRRSSLCWERLAEHEDFYAVTNRYGGQTGSYLARNRNSHRPTLQILGRGH
jgi:hypothetical protein